MSTFTERFSGKIQKMGKEGITGIMEGDKKGSPIHTNKNWNTQTHTQGMNPGGGNNR
jgi:hypothetical protein